jgi:hypothetical protein
LSSSSLSRDFLTSSAEIQSAYRVALTLPPSAALQEFFLICDSTEQIIAANPKADVDSMQVALSIGWIADISESWKDFEKSVAIREWQLSFVDYLQSLRLPQRGGVPAVLEYAQLFAQLRAAREMSE